ncbi:unnamed protein product [Prorocentrum cordatum]|uniref:5'-nucleotidase n=1 Tax=Prorocentrum cordatum TaxID=2364126 RepID=A0ABN9QWC1_9DINO|nr:unnamed protein product [Polarella glacialis]
METGVQAADPCEAARQVEACAAAARSGELLVIADFDRTMTRNFMPGGARCTSPHGVLEDAAVLSETFRSAAKELFQKYYPIEIDAEMPIEEKIPIMSEWYGQVHELMTKEVVTRDAIRDAVASCSTIGFRDGITELVAACQGADPPIPLLVMSAGLGDVIEEFFRQRLPFPLSATTMVVSNRMTFGDDGQLVGFSEPLLHMFNKTAAFMDDAARELTRGKRRCLLLGDGLGDLTMANGLEVETFKVGFLNENVEKRLESFCQGFHIVAMHDRSVPDMVFRAIGEAPAHVSGGAASAELH